MCIRDRDGVKEAHDRYRVHPDGRGSWEEAWRGLQNVRLYIDSNPPIRLTYTPKTVKYLYESVKFLLKHGLTRIAAEPVYEVEWTLDDLIELKNQLVKISELAFHVLRRGTRFDFKPIRDAISPYLTPFGRNPPEQKPDRCGLATAGIAVDYDGTIYPCHRFVSIHDPESEVAIGDVFNGINEEKRRNWITKWKLRRLTSSNPKLCINCPFKSACIGGCLAVNYDLYGDINTVPEWFCKIHRIYLEVFTPLYLTMKAEGNKAFQEVYLRRR